MHKVDNVFASFNEVYLCLDDVIVTVQGLLCITVPFREA